MSTRSKIGRFGALIAAALLAAGTLVLPSSTPPAVAQDACTPNEPNIFSDWEVMYNNRGVTLCQVDPLGTLPEASVQIVDLAAGAKLRLISDAVVPTMQPAEDNLYEKRSVSAWFDWVENNVTTPAPSRLFSTTNASFFIDTSAAVNTALSLPEMSNQFFPSCPIPPGACWFQHLTFGWASVFHSNPAWDAVKRGLVIGDPSSTPQDIRVRNFPTHYSEFAVAQHFGLVTGDTFWDGTVAFDPSQGSGAARRNFLGIAGSKVYTLTTTVNITLSDAQDILDSFGGSGVVAIQLDGGGSAQAQYDVGANIPSLLGREVPDVLAVYLAP